MSPDKMKNFAYMYYDFCNKLAEQIYTKEGLSIYPPKNNCDKKSNFFNKNDIESTWKLSLNDITGYADLCARYNSIMEDINNTIKFDYPEVIKNMIQFMNKCEEYFLFYNDDSKSVYSTYDKIKTGLSCLYIQNENYTIQYILEDSAINIPNEVTQYNGPLSFMNNEPNKTVLFATIIVKRHYGISPIISEFKFIQGSSPAFGDDKGEKILFKIINKEIKKVVLDTFNHIVNNDIFNKTDMKEKITVEEITSNAILDIWRY